jgi:hypothetical protein
VKEVGKAHQRLAFLSVSKACTNKFDILQQYMYIILSIFIPDQPERTCKQIEDNGGIFVLFYILVNLIFNRYLLLCIYIYIYIFIYFFIVIF